MLISLADRVSGYFRFAVRMPPVSLSGCTEICTGRQGAGKSPPPPPGDGARRGGFRIRGVELLHGVNAAFGRQLQLYREGALALAPVDGKDAVRGDSSPPLHESRCTAQRRRYPLRRPPVKRAPLPGAPLRAPTAGRADHRRRSRPRYRPRPAEQPLHRKLLLQ